MNQLTDPKTLASSTAIPALTPAQRFRIAIDALEALPALHQLSTIADIEGKTEDELARTPIAGTPLETIATALAVHGQPTAQTVDGVMKALDMSQADVHYLACECHEHSETMFARTAAERMEEIATWNVGKV